MDGRHWRRRASCYASRTIRYRTSARNDQADRSVDNFDNSHLSGSPPSLPLIGSRIPNHYRGEASLSFRARSFAVSAHLPQHTPTHTPPRHCRLIVCANEANFPNKSLAGARFHAKGQPSRNTYRPHSLVHCALACSAEAGAGEENAARFAYNAPSPSAAPRFQKGVFLCSEIVVRASAGRVSVSVVKRASGWLLVEAQASA